MGGVARRLDDEAREIEVRGQLARRDPPLDQRGDARLEIRKNVHSFRRVSKSSARLTQVRRPVKKAAMLVDGEAVGHSGDIVGRPRGRGRPAPPWPPSRAAWRTGRPYRRRTAAARSRRPRRGPRCTDGWRYMWANRKALTSRSAASIAGERPTRALPAARDGLGAVDAGLGDRAAGSRRSRPR